MAGITPIPTTRVSDQLANQRMLTQLRSDQLAIQKLQVSISTGRRIGFASEDAPAGIRAMSLQKLFERKEQAKVNLTTNQAYLSATDSALSTVSSMLNQARGNASAVAGTTSTSAQRKIVANDLQRVIQQLVDTGNHQFRGRQLFAGSITDVPPFELVGSYVRYNGNEKDLQSYADIDLLIDTNVNGAKVFGAVSQPMRGTADLDPNITRNMRLADLRQGAGISPGSILISDGTVSRTVDVSKAETVGDVIDLLEANPPNGRNVSVTLTSTGFQVALDSAGGGNLSIQDVGGGTTARDLGIFHRNGFGPGPVVGSDLNPRLTPTTQLDDILGVQARVSVQSVHDANDLAITARERGADWNGWTVNFTDDGTAVLGTESVTYDAVAKSITVNIVSGSSTSAHVKAALEADPDFAANFTVDFDIDESNSNDGAGLIELTATGTTAGGSGVEFDSASGLQILNGGQTYEIDLSSAKTIEDVLNILNGSGASLMASINAAGTGIDVRSRLSGADFAIGENGGQTAAQLGLRTFTAQTELADLNHSRGIHPSDKSDFIIRRADGVELAINVSGARTIGDVMDLINTHPDNLDPTTAVTARLNSFGNGIELAVPDGSGTSSFAVIRDNHSEVAYELGLIPIGMDQTSAATATGGELLLSGRDTNPQETAGIFNSLIRMRDALQTDNFRDIDRAMGMLDDDTDNINYVRGEIGSRQQYLDVLQIRIEDEQVEIESALSTEIGTDMTQTISDMLARQASYEASLAMAGQMTRLSLLDFL